MPEIVCFGQTPDSGPDLETGTDLGTAGTCFKPVTFTDAFGRKITIDRPLKKIAAGSRFNCEYLVGIGARDCVVMVTTYVTREPIFYPVLSRKPATGALHESPDFEAIIDSGAKAYIVNGHYVCEPSYRMAVKRLEPVVKVIAMSTNTLNDTYDTVSCLGRITGHEAGALAYNRFKRETLGKIRERVAGIPDRDKVRVYYEPMGPGWTINDKCMGFGYQIPAAGGINIAGNDLGHDFEWFETDKEWLVSQSPEIILLHTPSRYASGYGAKNYDGMKTHVRDSLARPEFRMSDAVKNRRVYSICWDLIGTPRMFVGVAYMARLFYPEHFRDMDPRAIHQHYLTQFIRLDYNLDKKGAFIYPSYNCLIKPEKSGS